MRKALFAPWRMEFIENHERLQGCVLCSMVEAKDDTKHHILARGKFSYVVMNKYPYSHGHMMVVPYRHEADFALLNLDELKEIGELTQRVVRLIRRDFQAVGFNIGINLGKAAGAGIDAHVHQHIVPRWVGDFNFMPVLAETKVISEHLDQTFKKLLSSWKTE
jgi:ATP adenylyltransferase